MRRFLIAVLALVAFADPAVADNVFVGTSFTQSVSSATASAFTWKQTVNKSPLHHFALQVTGTSAAASAWDVRLEGSLDGVAYAPLVQNATADGDGSIKYSTTTVVNFAPVNYIQAYVKSLSLGSATKITVSVLGTQ